MKRLSDINPNTRAWQPTSNLSTYSNLVIFGALAGALAQEPAVQHSVAHAHETSLDFSRSIYKGAINPGSASSLLLTQGLGEDLDDLLGNFAMGLLARQKSLGHAIETVLASHMNELYE